MSSDDKKTAAPADDVPEDSKSLTDPARAEKIRRFERVWKEIDAELEHANEIAKLVNAAYDEADAQSTVGSNLLSETFSALSLPDGAVSPATIGQLIARFQKLNEEDRVTSGKFQEIGRLLERNNPRFIALQLEAESLARDLGLGP